MDEFTHLILYNESALETRLKKMEKVGKQVVLYNSKLFILLD